MSDPRSPSLATRAVELIPKTPQETVKAILVIVVTLFAAVRASLSGDGILSPVEGVQLVIQALTLIPVFLLAGVWPKTIAAFLLAGLQALIPGFGALAGWVDIGSITFDDYAGAILAAMLAIGIAVIPNAPAPAPKDVVVVNETRTTAPAPSSYYTREEAQATLKEANTAATSAEEGWTERTRSPRPLPAVDDTAGG